MRKFGFMFPGQGSQKLGMLSNFATKSNVIQETFSEASDALGIDLWDIVQHDRENSLDQTQITQPVLLTTSITIWRLWVNQQGPEPSVLAGHSLGEYSALVCAGVIGFQDAVNVVFRRGQFMRSAVSEGKGKMAAIVGLKADKITEICKDTGNLGTVSVANFNSPGQIVIAGNTKAVEHAMALSKDAGAKRTVLLNISIPSHCGLMKPAAEQLERELANIKFKTPSIGVVQNANAEISNNPEKIKSNLIKQLYSPVRWTDCVKLISQIGIEKLVECGPGKVLCGLVKRIEPEMVCCGSDDEISLGNAIAEMSA